MAKRVKRSTISPFRKGVIIYAAVTLTLIGVGLALFWSFLTAYEASRPKNTVNVYLESLTAEQIREEALPALLEQVDTRVQDEAACRERLLEALQGELTAAKNVTRSTGDTYVYVLRQGNQAIGSFQMEQTGKPSWGFAPWTVTGEEFDLSFLLGDKVSLTVPPSYTVYVDGLPLPGSCVAEEGIPYPELAEFTGDYELPAMVRYEAGPFLGQAEVTLTDGEGNAVAPDAGNEVFLDNCAPEEKEAVEEAARAFVQTYVDYVSCTGSDPATTLQWLKKLMVPDSALAKRMRDALAGLHWVSDRHATVSGMEAGLISRVGEDLYFCEVAYTVNTRDITGQVQVENRVKLLLRQTNGKLLAEAMVTC